MEIQKHPAVNEPTALAGANAALNVTTQVLRMLITVLATQMTAETKARIATLIAQAADHPAPIEPETRAMLRSLAAGLTLLSGGSPDQH